MPIGTHPQRTLPWIAMLCLLGASPLALAQSQLDVDRRLAEKYDEPAPQVNDVAPAATPLSDAEAPVDFDEAAALRLEKEIDEALAEAQAEGRPPPVVDASIPTWATSTLLSAGVVLITFSAIMLILVVRQLRKEARQKRRTYRRRSRRRHAPPTDSAATAST